jgi:predicted dehydrogenase
MKRLRVGVVGVGYLGKFHAEKYAAREDVELVGIVDMDLARAQEIAGKLKTQAFDDPKQLLGRVDAVSVVVPTIHHHRVAGMFLENNVHVFVEKPIAATIAQADELIKAADRAGRVLQVGHIERFNPAVTALKPLLKAPRFMTAERSAPFTVRCTDVNVILDLMIHDLDVVMDLAGAAPRELAAAGASVITKEIDSATARIVFENGCVADVTASRVSEEKKRTLRVFDGDAVYFSDYQNQQAFVSCRRGTTVPEFVAEQIATDRRDTLADEVADFVASVQNGNKPRVTGVAGKRALAAAILITQTITQGKTGFVPVDL